MSKKIMKKLWYPVIVFGLICMSTLIACSSAVDGDDWDPEVDGDASDPETDGDENDSCHCPAGYACGEDEKCHGIPPVDDDDYSDGYDGGLADGDAVVPDGDDIMMDGDMEAKPDGDEGGYDPGDDTPLKAGEWDDNQNFDAFLEFLESHEQTTGVRHVDVSTRLEIVIADADGLPVPNAKVTITSDQSDSHVELRSFAIGSFLFHPLAYGMPKEGAFTIDVASTAGAASFTMDSSVPQPFIGRLSGQRELDQRIPVDIAITLDTTGSMSDQISQVQSTLLRIVERLNEHPTDPRLRFALIIYRDRGDSFVSALYDFIEDVDAFNELLGMIEAGGGGDFPESVNEALHRTMVDLSWSESAAVRVDFLIGDAPPHMDYQEDYEYDDAMKDAARMGIKILPIAASGVDGLWEVVCRQLAQFTESRYVFLTEGGYKPSVDGDTDDSENEDNLPYDIGSLDDIMVNAVHRELDNILYEW